MLLFPQPLKTKKAAGFEACGFSYCCICCKSEQHRQAPVKKGAKIIIDACEVDIHVYGSFLLCLFEIFIIAN